MVYMESSNLVCMIHQTSMGGFSTERLHAVQQNPHGLQNMAIRRTHTPVPGTDVREFSIFRNENAAAINPLEENSKSISCSSSSSPARYTVLVLVVQRSLLLVF